MTRPEVSRRMVLKGAVAAGLLQWSPLWSGLAGFDGATVRADEKPADRYANLDTAKYLGEVQIETQVPASRYFTEGPAVDSAGNVYFSNVPNHALSQILKWDPAAKKLAVFREPSNAANGNFFDSKGRLVTCEGGQDDKGRVTRTDMGSGAVTVLVDAYEGKPLGAPNDLVIDAQGRIYFTSRLAKADPQGGNVNAVYRLDPSGGIARVLAAPDIDMPNGIVLSPDEKTLYLVEADPRENRARSIRAYDLNAAGTVSNGRTLINLYPGRSADGMCIDSEGNLYLAAGLHKTRGTTETLDTRSGIHVVSPAGKLLAFVETPEDTITNCTFGGADRKTLYVTCSKYLLSIRTKIAGYVAKG